MVGLGAAGLFGFSVDEGLLLGAIVSSTDGAAIFALLRGSTLSRRLAQTLEGSPASTTRSRCCWCWLHRSAHPAAFTAGDVAVLFVRELGIGLAIGVLVGTGAVYALRRVQLPRRGLPGGVADGGRPRLWRGRLAPWLRVSGRVSGGLFIGSATIPAERTVVSFHQGLGWLAQVAMFLRLGLLVFPSQLPSVAVKGTALALVLVFSRARRGRSHHAPVPLLLAGAIDSSLGRSPWRRPRRAGHVPRDRAGPDTAGVLQHRLLCGAAIHCSARHNLRDVRPAAGLTTTEPALPRPLSESGTIRGLGAECWSTDRPRRRDRRRPVGISVSRVTLSSA